MSKCWKGQRSLRKSVFFRYFVSGPQLWSPVKTLVNEQEFYPCLRVTTGVFIIQICNMKLLWLSITFLGGSENPNFFSQQNKLAFWAGCREKRECNTLVLRPDLSYLGSNYPRYKFPALYLTGKVLKRAFENTNYSTTWIACTWRGVAPKLWRPKFQNNYELEFFNLHVFITHIDVP